jgi:arabinose-5-phosphate isomerase
MMVFAASLPPQSAKSIMDKARIIESARRTLETESHALAMAAAAVGDSFPAAVNAVLQSTGRLIVTGIGKSANIAQKMVATLNSTGQPASFMHAADAVHGDLGTVQQEDVVLCISKSGDSPEIKFLVPLIRSTGNVLIALTSNEKGYLAHHADHVLFAPVEREACPNNLAPTTSTTVQLAMGDALAVALMECRGFTTADFARYHPGGALGKKLYVRMGDLLGSNSRPAVEEHDHMRLVLAEISSKRLGAAAVLRRSKVIGIITDGDIRRMLEKAESLQTASAADIMSANPKVIEADALAVNGFHLMESNNITQLIVVKGEEYMGIVHLHDILKEGIF